MSPLQKIFRDRLIPWAESDLEQRLVVAQPVMKQAQMPDGVQLVRKRIQGPRVAVRKRRGYTDRLYHASWPEAGIHELEVAKLVCVVSGTTDYIAGEYVITCEQGHFLLLPPLTPNTSGGQPHLEGERRQSGFCELLQLVILPEAIRFLYCISQGEAHRTVPELSCIINHSQAAQLFRLFAKQAQAQEAPDYRLQQHLLSAFFCVLLNEINDGREVYTQFQVLPSMKRVEIIAELRNYLKAHLQESPTIENSARQMHMSPRQFTRYLRRETGQSFVNILTDCRIEEAKRLLLETPTTAAGVAHTLGFKSASYFNAFFRRHVGCTPGKFRDSSNCS